MLVSFFNYYFYFILHAYEGCLYLMESKVKAIIIYDHEKTDMLYYICVTMEHKTSHKGHFLKLRFINHLKAE